MVAYDTEQASNTGCNSPGYKATQVFSSAPVSGARDTKFHVRQRARSLYIKRRLLDPVSPTVWMQATIDVHNEHGVLVVQGHVAMVRFQVPERVLDIGAPIPVTTGQSQGVIAGLGDQLLKLLHLRDSNAVDAAGTIDDDDLDYDVLDARDMGGNATSTRYDHRHIHWSIYSLGIFGCLFVFVLLVVGVVCRSKRPRAKSGSSVAADGNDYEQVQNTRIVAWMRQGASQGLYHRGGGDGGTAEDMV
jgi:hypothetical protein